MMVVLSAYKQIRTQTGDHLSRPDEDNYDRAFDFYRPSETSLFSVENTPDQRFVNDNSYSWNRRCGRQNHPRRAGEGARLLRWYG